MGAVIGEADAADLGALPEQLTGLNDHVGYIHTKYLLIDPFSDDPIVVCFSFVSSLFNESCCDRFVEVQILVELRMSTMMKT